MKTLTLIPLAALAVILFTALTPATAAASPRHAPPAYVIVAQHHVPHHDWRVRRHGHQHGHRHSHRHVHQPRQVYRQGRPVLGVLPPAHRHGGTQLRIDIRL